MRRRTRLTNGRMSRESLKPTIDINYVEPNVFGNGESTVVGRERRGSSHFLGEFGASTT